MCQKFKVTVEAKIRRVQKVNTKFESSYDRYFEERVAEPDKAIAPDEATFKVKKDEMRKVESNVWLSNDFPLSYP